VSTAKTACAAFLITALLGASVCVLECAPPPLIEREQAPPPPGSCHHESPPPSDEAPSPPRSSCCQHLLPALTRVPEAAPFLVGASIGTVVQVAELPPQSLAFQPSPDSSLGALSPPKRSAVLRI